MRSCKPHGAVGKARLRPFGKRFLPIDDGKMHPNTDLRKNTRKPLKGPQPQQAVAVLVAYPGKDESDETHCLPRRACRARLPFG